MKKFYLTIAFLIIFSSCAVIEPLKIGHIQSKTVHEINYKINSTNSVYIGEPIARVKIYTVDTFSEKYLKASGDFYIENLKMTGKKNQLFEVIGIVNYKNRTHYVIALPVRSKAFLFYLIPRRIPQLGYLINEKGCAVGVLMNTITKCFIKGVFDIQPVNITFNRSLTESLNTESNFLHYEILYSGTDGINLFFLYREYSLYENKIPLFSQEITCEKHKSILWFRNTVVKVHEANNEKISYTVIKDGLHKLL